MRKQCVQIMEYLPKLAIISVLLNIGLLKLMYFNYLHLLLYNFTEVQGSQSYIVVWSIYVYGWNIMGCYNFRVLYL